MAERFGRYLAIIIGLRQSNKNEEALIYIDDLFLQTTGLTTGFINSACSSIESRGKRRAARRKPAVEISTAGLRRAARRFPRLSMLEQAELIKPVVRPVVCRKRSSI